MLVLSAMYILIWMLGTKCLSCEKSLSHMYLILFTSLQAFLHVAPVMYTDVLLKEQEVKQRMVPEVLQSESNLGCIYNTMSQTKASMLAFTTEAICSQLCWLT